MQARTKDHYSQAWHDQVKELTLMKWNIQDHVHREKFDKVIAVLHKFVDIAAQGSGLPDRD